MRRWSVALAAGLLATAACARPAPEAAPEARIDLGTINRTAAPKPTLTLAYAAQSPHQVGELRVPRGRGPFPVAMLVHGGCWTAGMGAVENLRPLAVWLTAHGVATWSVDYREVGSGGGWPGTFEDWALALRAVPGLAKRYPLDLTRISVIGHSAGVTAAAWLPAEQTPGGPAGDAPLPPVRSLVALDGPLSVAPFIGVDAAICGLPAIVPLMGGTPEQVPDRYARTDPLRHPPNVRQAVIVVAALPEQDPSVLAKVRASGAAVTEIRTPDPWHFQLLVPGTRDFRAIEPALLEATGGR